ncbi:hypothetical protein PSN45_004958 [Yamadazyma tenuis]|uniref:Autophagy-related protein 101 n=1 Tax=Candida tenuis (strain ATCC 10573 / BCRC 21748 / CBS 615 / JCM 9827 / NBRC 10315 / NRRL Y-1498 / VKM Y-70) TaxID=590646 RepID=G3B2A0_CANTC|nr:uncharacterized protein CANTEDRAFT_113406 [Yamadazyma tenuis ATCC 10573]XP_006685878.1 uncharacterized protein CANTEDRAFT_113406 [Yamadazyma tenuis ATCC 10573]EGV65071.1 hypothetical protein CANTEDRAFT_113406 [Yamadazyma tenuis ATCC 10573]EGV65072.1 hypothetical protein CANTEDRAFT_113406 [Yamadazyma tenuis ATCC 10573]WEJ97407.1 hypothetical protein PSN45_004958 [Yamadazyma tenuis]
MEYTLSLVAERSVVRESLKGIIWSIFFHRLFGPITPAMCEFLGVPYPVASDLPDLDSLVDEKIDQLIRMGFSFNNTDLISPLNAEVKYGVVTVRFLDLPTTKSKKKTGWFGQGKSDDEVDLKLWESWIIQIKCLPVLSESSSDKKLHQADHHLDPNVAASVSSFEDNLLKIIDIADSHKDHIPPITSLESAPFPYVINVELLERKPSEDESWGSYIKKIL